MSVKATESEAVKTADEFRAELLPFGSHISEYSFIGNTFKCPKCGTEIKDDSMDVKFCQAYGGYLKYRCRKCEYAWRTKTADCKDDKVGVAERTGNVRVAKLDKAADCNSADCRFKSDP